MKNAWIWARANVGLPVMIVIFVTGGYFVYTFIRDWQTRHAIQNQTERIDKYAQQSAVAVEETNRHLADFAQNNAVTLDLLDTIKGMSGNIKKLAETDQTVTVRVAPLGSSYENARNQKSSSAAKSRVPIRQREDGVLAADRSLYPK